MRLSNPQSGVWSPQRTPSCSIEMDKKARLRTTELHSRFEQVDSLVYKGLVERQSFMQSADKQIMRGLNIEASGRALHNACWNDEPLSRILEIICSVPEAIDFLDDEGRSPIDICKLQSRCCRNGNRRKVMNALARGKEYYVSNKCSESGSLPVTSILSKDSFEQPTNSMAAKHHFRLQRRSTSLSEVLDERENFFKAFANEDDTPNEKIRNIKCELKYLEDEYMQKMKQLQDLKANFNHMRGNERSWRKKIPTPIRRMRSTSASREMELAKIDLKDLMDQISLLKEAEVSASVSF